jgi:hypothetical protein
MGLEAATYINDLITANPVGSDDRSTADDHLRLIKSVLKSSFTGITGAVTATHTEINKLDGHVGAVPAFGTAQAWTRQQYFTETTLADGAGIDWNLAENQVAKVTLGGNRTLNAPTNMQAGATYILRIIQDATGSRTLTFNAAYKFPAGLDPTLTTTPNAVDIISCVSDGTSMFCSTMLDVK